MTDRELLELAAKAAGYEVEEHNAKLNCVYVYNPQSGTGGNMFAPLTRNGDAFSLMVKLKIEPRQVDKMCSALYSADTPAGFAICNEVYNGDPEAAARLAIVRAAAEIGKEMK